MTNYYNRLRGTGPPGVLGAMILSSKHELKVTFNKLARCDRTVDALMSGAHVDTERVRVLDDALRSWSFERSWLLDREGFFVAICKVLGMDRQDALADSKQYMALSWNGFLLRKRIEEWRREGSPYRRQAGRAGPRERGLVYKGRTIIEGIP